MAILDTELRIVTPTDEMGIITPTYDLAVGDLVGSELRPEPSKATVPSTAFSAKLIESRFYQLTHDYLVPSIREWLNRKRKETRRGRAGLLLEERANHWSRSREDRLLPTVWEWLRIAALVRRANHTPIQREMMRRALFVYGVRLAGSLVVSAVLAFVVYATVPFGRQPFATAELVTMLETENDPAAVTRILEHLGKEYQDRASVHDAFVLVLVKLLGHQSDKIRHAAFARLVKVAEPQAVVATVRSAHGEVAVEDSSRVVVGEAEVLASEAALRFLVQMVTSSADAERVAAFQILAGLAPIRQVLPIVGERYDSSIGERLAAVLDEYVRDMNLANLSQEHRTDTLRQLLSFIRAHRSQHLVTCCVEQLDQYQAGSLCDWLFEAYPDKEPKEAAKLSLVAYTRKTKSDRRREIQEYIEERLPESQREAEYFEQAIGHIQALGESRDSQ